MNLLFDLCVCISHHFPPPTRICVRPYKELYIKKNCCKHLVRPVSMCINVSSIQ
jgi:hypothetical protein